MPTLNHYCFLNSQEAIQNEHKHRLPIRQCSQKWQTLQYMMEEKKVLVRDLYLYFHSRNHMEHGFKLRSNYQLAVEEMFGHAANLADMYMRFVDLDVIERMDTPLVLMDIEWQQMQKLKSVLHVPQKRWLVHRVDGR